MAAEHLLSAHAAGADFSSTFDCARIWRIDERMPSRAYWHVIRAVEACELNFLNEQYFTLAGARLVANAHRPHHTREHTHTCAPVHIAHQEQRLTRNSDDERPARASAVALMVLDRPG